MGDVRNIANSGGKWIRPEKRLAIYLRDKLTCSWCNSKLSEHDATLDHLRPQKSGVDNSPRNLVTSCRKCNSARGSRGIREFAEAVANYVDNGETTETVLMRIRRRRRRNISIAWARSLILLNRTLGEIFLSRSRGLKKCSHLKIG